MKIEISETTPLQLDWLVAKCLSLTIGSVSPSGVFTKEQGWFAPTTDPAQAWPIIEREKIWIKFPFMTEGCVEAIHGAFGFPNIVNAFGPTSLMAAMRCYVVSKVGDEVEVPDGLAPTDGKTTLNPNAVWPFRRGSA
jgi:Protein of unknown function (DUF2591)